MSDQFKASLRALPAAKSKHEQSPARARISEAFDDITTARSRGVSWQQIADLMTRDGITGTDGKPMTAARVNSLYAAEKALRGGRRKRRTKTPITQPLRQTTPAGGAAPFEAVEPEDEQPEPPKRGFRLSKAVPKGYKKG